MKRIPCQYAIVRFTPFIETGEFANAGIILISSKERYFCFKLLNRRYGRITQFFRELDSEVFRSAMRDLGSELERVHNLLKAHGFDRRLKFNDVDFAQSIFAEIIRPRESIIRFSKPRVVLAEDPKEKIKELFAFYVERAFVTKEYRETVLEKRVRTLLYKAHIGDRFMREKVGDDEYKVPFPFVELRDHQPAKIIKPLNLAQDDSSKILEHGGKWRFRVRQLKKRHALPEKVLFAVDGPGDEGPRGNAYHEAVEMLTETGVSVFPCRNTERIIDFALRD